MRVKFFAVAVAVTAVITLAGCASGQPPYDYEGTTFTTDSPDKPVKEVDTHNSHLSTKSVVFQDGTVVDCIVYDDQEKGGVNCEWPSYEGDSSYPTDTDKLHPAIEDIDGQPVYCVVYDSITKGGLDCDM